MDIAALSVDMHQMQLATEVGIALLDKSMDTMQDMGDGMVKMMEASVTPHIGQNIDVSV